MKVKIKDFLGLYTNIDQNDTRPEAFQDTKGFVFKNGFAESEFPEFANLVCDSRYNTNPTNYLPYEDGYEFETGIATKVSSDALSSEPVYETYNILVVVLKKLDAGVYYRKVWLLNLSASTPAWLLMEYLSSTAITVRTNYIATTQDGRCFLVPDAQGVNIYMPHMIFRLQRLKRKFNPEFLEWVQLTYTNESDVWYFDAIVQNKINPFVEEGISEGRYGLSIVANQVPFDAAIANTYTKEGILVLTISQLDVLNENEPPRFYAQFSIYSDNGFLIADKINGTMANPEDDTSDVTMHEGELKKAGCNLLPENVFTYSQANWVNPSVVKPVYTAKEETVISTEYFETDKGAVDLLITAEINKKAEVVIWNQKGPLPSSGSLITNYMIKLNTLRLPVNISLFTTAFKVYFKRAEDVDYNLFHTFNTLFQDGIINALDNLYIVNRVSGITLSQNIGIIFDPKTYKVITGLSQIAKSAGVSIALESNNKGRVLYSVLGGGKLQEDLFYEQNTQTFAGANFITAINTIGNNFAVHTLSNMFIVAVDVIGSSLVFTAQDTMELGAKDENDVADMKGSALVHSKTGIYITNGYDKNNVSEPINDIVKANWDTGKIYFDRVNKKIYYIVGSTVYEFDMTYQKWRKLGFTQWTITQVLNDYDGNPVLLHTLGMLTQSTGTQSVRSYDNYFITNSTDLGEPLVDKLINNIAIDLIGPALVTVYGEDGSQYASFSVNATTRLIKPNWIPFANRKPTAKVYFKVELNRENETLKIYGIEVDFDVIQRRLGSV